MDVLALVDHVSSEGPVALGRRSETALRKGVPLEAQVFEEFDRAGEPHRSRRRALIREHPEVTRLFGPDVRTAWVTVVVWFGQMLLALTVSRLLVGQGLGWSLGGLLLASYFVGSILSHWLGMTIHETSHNLAFRSRSANRWLALFANLPMVVPIAMTFHRYHLDHHRLLGVLGEDTDLPSKLEVEWVGRSPFRKFLWLAPYMLTYGLRGLTFVRAPNRREVLNVVLQLGFGVGVFLLMGPWALAYLALSTFFGHSLHPVAAHFIHEHYLFAPTQETYSYYGPLNAVTFNVGYHVEHHDLMAIPGWRLPEVRAMAPEFYEPLLSHQSWTWVLVRFVLGPIGIGSRRVRLRSSKTPSALAPAFSD